VNVVSVDVLTGVATGKEAMTVRLLTPFAVMLLLFMARCRSASAAQ